jgi:hypothetical protein
MAFRENEIIILLGAGASVEAEIPAAVQMIYKVEELLDGDWAKFKELYHYVKSAMHYAEGIKGNYSRINYNIEALVNTLDDLRRGRDHPLYPFIGSWNPRFAEVTGNNLEVVADFRKAIVEKLRDKWVQPPNYQRAKSYYRRLHDFQKGFNYVLRVFTLNYDLCVEKSIEDDVLERGFDADGIWNWRLFDDNIGSSKAIFLYKLHGSIDWTRNANGNLTFYETPSHIDAEDLAIIFGTTYKLQYVDPFLFCAYELRKWTLDAAKLIITIGYGFGDEHINGILSQALNSNSRRRLLAVGPLNFSDESERNEKESARAEEIGRVLGLKYECQVVFRAFGASNFMQNHLNIRSLQDLFPPEPDFPDLIAETPERLERE